MRFAKPAAALPWAALCACFLWTVYSHMNIRKLVVDETSSAYNRISEDIRSLDVSSARMGRVELLEQAANLATHMSNASAAASTDAVAGYEALFFHQRFDNSSASPRTYNTDPKVWLYSLITTDYDGPKLVPHFLQHYSDVGVQTSMIYVDLLHDPALADNGLMEARRQFQSAGVHTRTIPHAYTPDLQDLAMITGLSQIPMQPEDWVIVADMDEYFTFGSSSTVQEAVQAMEEEGATFALGEMLDHVAPGGALKRVSTATDIWSQFPLICPIVSNIAKGLPAKVTIHKAYLRSGAGHHHIVEPYLAEAYFGSKCDGLQCELVLKRYKQRTTRDVYPYTPYKQYAQQYADSVDASGWQAKRWLMWTKVHHFKWHAAVLDNLLSRMVRDSGDCVLEVNEDNCQPVFQFWQEVARQFMRLNATQSIDITDLDCKEGVDTLWNW